MVFSGVLWYSVVFCGIQLYIVVISGNDQCSIVGGPKETGEG